MAGIPLGFRLPPPAVSTGTKYKQSSRRLLTLTFTHTDPFCLRSITRYPVPSTHTTDDLTNNQQAASFHHSTISP